jgi:hypothetical protein
MLGEALGVESVEDAGEGESQSRDCVAGSSSAGWGEGEGCVGEAEEVGDTGETTGGAA